MAIYKYGTVSFGTTAQTQLNLGYIPSVFRMKNLTIQTNGTGTGLTDVYWDQGLAALATPYTLIATSTTGAPVWTRLASGNTTTATGIVPYSTPDSNLFVPNQAPYTTISGNRAYINQSTLLVITNITRGATTNITATHSFTSADIGVTVVTFHGLLGITQLNGLSGIITAVNSTTDFNVNINSSNFGAYSAGTAGLTGGFANVITGAPANTLYSNVSLPTAEANLGSTGLIIGTSILGGGTVATTDVWSYEAILQSPVTGP